MSSNAKPIVSVICATYNHSPYLATCLNSIVGQETDFDIEIIVHDDASTDGTQDLILAYARQYPQLIRPIIQHQNQYSDTHKLRIELLEHARGEFVAICDGDDYWGDPRKLSKQLRFLREHPECVLCYHDVCVVDERGETIKPAARSQNCNYSAKTLRVLGCGWLPLVSVMHRNVMMDAPPEFHLAPNSDHFLPVLLAPFGGAGYCPNVLPSAIRHHGGNVFSAQTASRRNTMRLRSYVQIASYLLRIGEEQNAKTVIRTGVWKRFCRLGDEVKTLRTRALRCFNTWLGPW